VVYCSGLALRSWYDWNVVVPLGDHLLLSHSVVWNPAGMEFIDLKNTVKYTSSLNPSVT